MHTQTVIVRDMSSIKQWSLNTVARHLLVGGFGALYYIAKLYHLREIYHCPGNPEVRK